jgi:hypothetical protein
LDFIQRLQYTISDLALIFTGRQQAGGMCRAQVFGFAPVVCQVHRPLVEFVSGPAILNDPRMFQKLFET